MSLAFPNQLGAGLSLQRTTSTRDSTPQTRMPQSLSPSMVGMSDGALAEHTRTYSAHQATAAGQGLLATVARSQVDE